MLGSIKYNFRHLFDFKGRDARQTFWYFVLVVYIATTALTMLVTIPVTISAMADAFTLAQYGDPDLVERQMSAAMAGMMKPIVLAGMASGIACVLLLAAAFVRRLHDSSLSGWWALIPAGLYTAAIVRMPGQTDKVLAAMAAQENAANPFATMQAQGSLDLVLGWLPILIVIIAGVRKSSDGPNRYGEEPVRF